MLFVDASNPTLLGIAAIVAAVGGIVSTIVGARHAAKEERKKADEECFEKLKVARAEAEAVAAELHKLRMKEFDDKA